MTETSQTVLAMSEDEVSATSALPSFVREMLEGASEPLHPELARCREMKAGALGWPMVRHPLVYAVPYFEQMNVHLNRSLAYKLERLEKARSEGDLAVFVGLHERPYRVNAILDWVAEDRCLPTEESARAYWHTLSWAWRDSENILEQECSWKGLWLTPPHAELYTEWRHFAMNDADKATLKEFAPTFEIYHGEEMPNRVGWSWTTNLKVAKWFANRFGGKRRVYRATVDKSALIAYLDGRGEQEVLVDPQLLQDVRVLRKLPSR